MTETTAALRRRLQAAGDQLPAKLQAFHEILTPDEQLAFELALQHISAGSDGSTDDVSGYWDTSNVHFTPGGTLSGSQVGGLVKAATLGFIEVKVVYQGPAGGPEYGYSPA